MKVSIKLDHPRAQLPKKSRPSDAAFDLVAVDRGVSFRGNYIEYDTGVCIEIPEGYAGFIYPRSSISKYDLQLANSIGLIDPNYRGRIKLRFRLIESINSATIYKTGDRIGQLIIVPLPSIQFIEAVSLSETERADNGFGSSGT